MADMMQSFGLGNLGNTMKGAADTAYSAVVWVALLVVIVGALAFIWWYMSYNRRITINYEARNGVRLSVLDKAKLKKIKGANYWKILRLKKTWLAPPGEAIRITPKGKFYAECNYKEGDDRPAWIILKESEPKDENGVKTISEQTYFSPEDRALLVEQMEEANNRNKSLLNTLMQLALPIAFVIILVLLLVFWKDIWQPMKESQQYMAGIAQQQAEISEQNARLFSIMAGKLDIKELQLKQVIPSDNTLFYGNNTG